MSNDYREFISANRENILRDIKRLVDIKSVKAAPAPGAPYGEDVRRVQLETMALCRENGLEVTDVDGRIAYAHLGDPDRFIGIIAHLDVVPEGTGWDSPPYETTERDGFLVGRGTSDDKGPFVLALYAVKYLIERKVPLKYGIRLIIGLDEETGMSDIDYYNERCTAPLFAFTPDADFPVGHGEKGIFSANLVSPPVTGCVVKELNGGVASNVVPDTATALLCDCVTDAVGKAAKKDNITATPEAGGIRVVAKGIAKHAGSPQGGVNAIHELVQYLLQNGIVDSDEAAALSFIETVSGTIDGSPFGIACDDGLFTPLTLISGMISKKDDRFVLNVNSRYPTAIGPAEMEQKITATCAANGYAATEITNSAPFYLDPATPAVRILCDIYNEITGADEKPFVMSGGTYARHMKNAVSFGIERPNPDYPEWVGTAHMKNEAICIADALEACEIFINTLIRLQEVEL